MEPTAVKTVFAYKHLLNKLSNETITLFMKFVAKEFFIPSSGNAPPTYAGLPYKIVLGWINETVDACKGMFAHENSSNWPNTTQVNAMNATIFWEKVSAGQYSLTANFDPKFKNDSFTLCMEDGLSSKIASWLHSYNTELMTLVLVSLGIAAIGFAIAAYCKWGHLCRSNRSKYTQINDDQPSGCLTSIANQCISFFSKKSWSRENPVDPETKISYQF